jgi:hypothetical protein
MIEKSTSKMKRIEDVLNHGYSIQIYTKYNEDSLIKLLKPSLNKVAGSGICGREFGNTENVYLYKKKIEKTLHEKYYESSMKTFVETNNYVIQLPMDIVYSIIEKEKQKYEPNEILQSFYQNTYIVQLMCTKYKKVGPLFTNLFQILKYCKIHCLYFSYVLIHKVYLENVLNHVELYSAWLEAFKHFDNYQKIHCEIVSTLKENHYLTNSILDYKNQSFELNRGPSYYYRQALSLVINESYFKFSTA